ncbi:MAG: phytanoyl-CoA dioxygenase family protein [Bacteroidota bacterium]
MSSSPLSIHYPITDEQRAHYQRDGFILLRNVLDPGLVEQYRRAILAVVEDVSRSRDKQGRISDYSAMFTQVTNVWRHAEAARELVCAPRFARIAADLMGVKGTRLYHDQALIKEPGAKPTPWHQDHYYWPLDTPHTITMWMPLVDVEPKMGSMTFVPGSHRDESFQKMAISESSQQYFEEIVRDRGVVVPSFSLNAGDATFHDGWTLHSAHRNASDRRREVMTVIYYADGTRLLEPDNEHRKTDMEVFHPGQKPGELAASELNPLLYSRQ